MTLKVKPEFKAPLAAMADARATAWLKCSNWRLRRWRVTVRSFSRALAYLVALK
jgi:hypothetical protein